jgi:hypothetical protein
VFGRLMMMRRTDDQTDQVVDSSGAVAEAAGIGDEATVDMEVGVARVLELIDHVHRQIPAAQQAEAASKGMHLSPKRIALDLQRNDPDHCAAFRIKVGGVSLTSS